MTEPWIVRAVVGLVGAVAIISLILVGALALTSRPVPDALIATLSSSLGALSAMLVRTSTETPTPTPVQVMNDPRIPEEAVPVTGDGL